MASVYENYRLCASLNATMVSIHSNFELSFVRSLLILNGDYDFWYWLGGIQVADRLSSFAWTDGSVFNYSRWDENHPNREKNFRCLAINMHIEHNWHSTPCNHSHRQLCQKSRELKNVFYDTEYPEYFIGGLLKNQEIISKKLAKIEQILTEITKNKNVSQMFDMRIEVNSVNNDEQEIKNPRFEALKSEKDECEGAYTDSWVKCERLKQRSNQTDARLY
ncbi:type-2 ice-structuring protein-like protein [Dinothrombium tinctorium]|uniref:Type-2 ice-structuring protein-like protein n=1 Tax=Dinothrombium tinctorium TaxID=1965070 RepID=A0A3S3S445_9ACAR|nr:type-2 ice-structuring protein-like protein [Dinothrombium tinctorium]RWS00492.1 type-2 ice-structuring protein-like protein [Dinothrombium tinctorium]RWS10110.1 type-2 ice-structuring protein-like protein [Dinothrombium tinctorium]